MTFEEDPRGKTDNYIEHNTKKQDVTTHNESLANIESNLTGCSRLGSLTTANGQRKWSVGGIDGGRLKRKWRDIVTIEASSGGSQRQSQRRKA